MRKLFFIFSLVTIVLSVVSCNNKLNILAPYQDITVVYGLLDQNDSIHYIRVNKAYQTSGNAYTTASNYDSINYPAGTITVQLQDNSSGIIITLDTTTGVALNAGTFSYPKQTLYYTKIALNVNDQYNLIVTNKKTNKVITGSTTLLPDVSVTTGGSSVSFISNRAIDFTGSNEYPTLVTWYSNSLALIYQLNMQFYYNEIDSIKKDTTIQYINWTFPEHTSPVLESGYPFSDEYTGTNFLELVKTSINPPPPNIKRVPKYMVVSFSSGSNDLNTYIQLSQPSLDANQQKPFYTDLKNGIGIFTSRHVQTAIRPLSSETIDSLANGAIDQGLNFKAH